jgi:hypothetical protein
MADATTNASMAVSTATSMNVSHKGDALFALVLKIVNYNYDLAGKVTGMLLDGCDPGDLLTSEDLLCAKVTEALEILAGLGASADADLARYADLANAFLNIEIGEKLFQRVLKFVDQALAEKVTGVLLEGCDGVYKLLTSDELLHAKVTEVLEILAGLGDSTDADLAQYAVLANAFLNPISFVIKPEDEIEDGFTPVSDPPLKNAPSIKHGFCALHVFKGECDGNCGKVHGDSLINLDPKLSAICKFNVKGCCGKGANCPFSHNYKVVTEEEAALIPPTVPVKKEFVRYCFKALSGGSCKCVDKGVDHDRQSFEKQCEESPKLRETFDIYVETGRKFAEQNAKSREKPLQGKSSHVKASQDKPKHGKASRVKA